MSLYQKYRPTSLDGVFGNDKIKSTLKGMFKKDDVPHTILFHGPTGCGKTTIARIVANQLGCEDTDLIELDSAQFRGIDTARDIRRNSNFKSISGGVKVYILDEVQKITGDGQNALLKVLEDTPPHVYFFLCTTDPQKLIAPLRGRCSQFQVEVLSEEHMLSLVTSIAVEEGVNLEEEVLTNIVKSGNGFPRNTINVLEQVLAAPKKQRLELAKQAINEEAQYIDLCRALMDRKADWNKVRTILAGLKGQEAETIRRTVLGYASAVLLNGDNKTAGLILEVFLTPLYDSGFPGLVSYCYTVLHG